jgi:hypothetical protein
MGHSLVRYVNANIIKHWFREIGIPLLDWPLHSPNLNLIECDSSREGGRTEEALSRYPDRKESHEGDTRPETAVFTRILN